MKCKLSLNEAVSTLIPFLSERDVCPKQALKKAYKVAALYQHPDRNGTTINQVTMSDLNSSWSIIKKSTKEQLQILLDGINGFKAPIEEWEVDPLRGAKVPSFESVDTMINDSFNIVDSFSELSQSKFYISGDVYYVKDLNLSFEFVTSFWSASILITDLSNALSSKNCKQVLLKREGNEQHALSIFHDVKNWLGDFNSMDLELIQTKVDTIIKGELPGKYTFSPFHLDRLKPLDKLPKQWRGGNRQQLIRAIANGQYMEFTEDFSFEMDGGMYDRGRSYIHNPMTFLKSAIINPSSEFRNIWGKGESLGSLCFGPHSNESCSLIVVLENRFPLEDMKDEFDEKIKIEDNTKLGLAS